MLLQTDYLYKWLGTRDLWILNYAYTYTYDYDYR